MKQIKKTIIILLILISICSICVPYTSQSRYNYQNIEYEYFFGGGGGFPDVGAIARDIVNAAISPIPVQISNDVGIPHVVSLTKHISQMMSPTEQILKNISKINGHVSVIMKQLQTDNGNIDSVTPTIIKCINRIEYCRQRINNIGTTASLLKFMILNRRIRFSRKSAILFYQSIIETLKK